MGFNLHGEEEVWRERELSLTGPLLLSFWAEVSTDQPYPWPLLRLLPFLSSLESVFISWAAEIRGPQLGTYFKPICV